MKRGLSKETLIIGEAQWALGGVLGGWGQWWGEGLLAATVTDLQLLRNKLRPERGQAWPKVSGWEGGRMRSRNIHSRSIQAGNSLCICSFSLKAFLLGCWPAPC